MGKPRIGKLKLVKLIPDGAVCEYEEWSKFRKSMVNCGKHAFGKCGNKFVYKEHFDFLRSNGIIVK